MSHFRARVCHRSRRFATALALGISAAALASCNVTAPSPSEPGSELPSSLDQVRAINLDPRFPQPGAPVDVGAGADRARVYYGSSGEAVARAGTRFGQAGEESGEAGVETEGVDLNFENTPVTAVAKVILGDLLNVGYVIDPRVQGTISLASGRKVKKSDLLFILESALRTANAVLVRDAGGYRILPADDAIGSGGVERTRAETEPGYGITVIPLRYASVAAITKILDGFATKPGTIRADTTHNLVIVTGNGNERRSALETVLSFDVDFMRGQSVGIFPIHNTTPEPLLPELEKIMDSSENGASHNLIKFQPISRLNAILVVARRPELLRAAGTWISRLDGSTATSTGVKVYKVRYGDARQISKLLSDMFIGGGAAGQAGGAELAPGAGATSLSAFGRLTGGAGGAGGGGGGGGGGGLSQSSFQQQGQAPTSSFPGQGGGQGQGFGQGFGGQSSSQEQTPYGGLGSFDTSSATNAPIGAQGQGQGATGVGTGGPALLAGVRILPDVANNAVVIYANAENYRIIERALNQLDRPQTQVAIDLTIAEVTLNDQLNYGVQFFLGSSNLGLGVNNGSASNTATSLPIQPVLPNGTGFNLVVGNALSPHVVINALHQLTDVKILSNPSIVVVNNGVATMQVGDQVPVQTGSITPTTGGSVTSANTFDYRSTGIILRVQPRINSNGNVLLDVEQEISAVASPGTAAIPNPTISQRRVKSSILVTSGQTVLLAGLIGDTQTKIRAGIPLLDELPLVGEAFGNSNQKSLVRTELIIFLRPQVIRDSVDAAYIAEELRSKMRGDKIGSTRPPGAVEPRPPRPFIR